MPDIFSPKLPEEPKQPKETHPKPHPANDAVASVEKLMHSPHHQMGLFATYAKHPKGITFTNQEPDEDILLFLRRHFITNIPWVIATFFLFLLPPILLFLISLFNGFVLPQGLTIVLTIFYYLIVISYAFSKFISWFYNIGIVTQKRIVDLDSTNILSHNTATATFNEIVDVKFTQRGFFQSTFDYGDIHIQTEALRANFEFDASPKPTEVADLISDLRVTTMKGHPHGNS
jgi:hypothetical protein